jgi:hypothetical protein
MPVKSTSRIVACRWLGTERRACRLAHHADDFLPTLCAVLLAWPLPWSTGSSRAPSRASPSSSPRRRPWSPATSALTWGGQAGSTLAALAGAAGRPLHRGGGMAHAAGVVAGACRWPDWPLITSLAPFFPPAAWLPGYYLLMATTVLLVFGGQHHAHELPRARCGLRCCCRLYWPCWLRRSTRLRPPSTTLLGWPGPPAWGIVRSSAWGRGWSCSVQRSVLVGLRPGRRLAAAGSSAACQRSCFAA